jgi:hypothetical protein
VTGAAEGEEGGRRHADEHVLGAVGAEQHRLVGGEPGLGGDEERGEAGGEGRRPRARPRPPPRRQPPHTERVGGGQGDDHHQARRVEAVRLHEGAQRRLRRHRGHGTGGTVRPAPPPAGSGTGEELHDRPREGGVGHGAEVVATDDPGGGAGVGVVGLAGRPWRRRATRRAPPTCLTRPRSPGRCGVR